MCLGHVCTLPALKSCGNRITKVGVFSLLNVSLGKAVVLSALGPTENSANNVPQRDPPTYSSIQTWHLFARLTFKNITQYGGVLRQPARCAYRKTLRLFELLSATGRPELWSHRRRSQTGKLKLRRQDRAKRPRPGFSQNELPAFRNLVSTCDTFRAEFWDGTEAGNQTVNEDR